MTDILVKPDQLHQTANHLRERAKATQAAMERIEQIFGELPPERFSGHTSFFVRSQYNRRRETLQNSQKVTLRFAQALDQIADRFSGADRALGQSHPAG